MVMESHRKAICLQNDVLKIEENNRNGLKFQKKNTQAHILCIIKLESKLNK